MHVYMYLTLNEVNYVLAYTYIHSTYLNLFRNTSQQNSNNQTFQSPSVTIFSGNVQRVTEVFGYLNFVD